MASGEGSSESLTHKTWVLKVSIHCQGCKKKVLKILKAIPGVYETEVDARLNKVTVKADVDAETLIRGLEKSGKHAELWPEKKPANQTTDNGDASGKQEGKGTPKPKEPVVDSDTTPSASKPSEAAKVNAKPKPQAEPSRTDDKTSEITTEKQLPTSESKKADGAKKEAEEPAAADADNKATASDGSGKKKGKQVKNQYDEVAVNNFPARSTNSPPPQDFHNYPQHAPLPPPLEYVMSYNVAQSSGSQSYYAPPAPPASQSYLHTLYPYPYPYPPPPEFYGDHPYYNTPAWMQPQPQPQPQPHDNMFNDENPNACNIM